MFEDCNVICWGLGKNFYSYLKRLEQCINIVAFCDNNENKWGKAPVMDGRKCLKPMELKDIDNTIVIITLDQNENIVGIEKQLDDMKVEHYRVKDVICMIEYKPDSSWLQKNTREHVHKFIDLNLHGTTSCNFHCDYCYVWRRFGVDKGTALSQYSPQEIRNGLSQKKLGGICYINICARGETLLADRIVELLYELLEEGHYVSVVTNGTVTNNIKKIMKFPPQLQSRMFFKFSFHYLELKKRKMFDLFWDNVDAVKKSKCSYTLEITPYDGLVGYIDNIKKMFEEKADGAMPHISFARDSTKAGYDVLSDYSVEEYNKIWKTFDSKMFELKSKYYGKKITEYCYAGQWSYLVNAMTGDIKSCYAKDVIGNIFDDNMSEFPVCEVGHGCQMQYCFNNHAFLAWGNVPEIHCSNYLEMRDRVDKDGNHWVKEPFYSFINEKLSQTNFQYAEKWEDYSKLNKKERKASIILFNSPDYSNIGDHAIALAERKFFNQYFPEYEFIEIACSEYQLENSRILKKIKDNDIVVISGGGNIGNLYLRIEDYIVNVISQLKHNIIFIFPQSVYFEQNEFGKKELKYFNSVLSEHGHVYLTVRDEQSFKFAKDKISSAANISCMPDIALFLRPKILRQTRNEILLCLRKDNESIKWNISIIKDMIQKMNCKIKITNTLYESEITLSEREEKVSLIMKELSHKKLVITDRLHGMILCALVGTPCVALDNISHKLSGTYQWLAEIPYIQCVRDEKELFQAIKTVINAEIDFSRVEKIIGYKFNEFAEEIRKEIREI